MGLATSSESAWTRHGELTRMGFIDLIGGYPTAATAESGLTKTGSDPGHKETRWGGASAPPVAGALSQRSL